ncbi:MAG: tetratricopeptide repeat protein [Bdellovibrio sp.]|nr:tetratricopeptide repeat protein [Bdellovibrio sp.]
MILKWGMIVLLGLSISSCLKTRAEVGDDEQSQVYTKKHADNQASAQSPQQTSQLNGKSQPTGSVDERDELIRTLNGRVEGLENQLNNINKEKTEKGTQDVQKVQLLQEALTKMEAQIQKLENEQAMKDAAKPRPEPVTRPSGARVAGSDKNEVVAASAKASAYESAQEFFAKKEWKKAIFNYQKYADESPKGKNVADAKYKIGVCFQELGMKEEAMAFYEEVIANYSKSEAGKKAKMRLAKLKK